MPLPKRNHEKIHTAVRLLLEGIGCDPDEGAYTDTPGRVSRMLDKIMDGNFMELSDKECRQFENENEYRGIVMVHHVPFYSFCAHHLLPFRGQFALGYLPGDNILGLSKLVRIFRHACKVPCCQEDITQSAVDKIMAVLGDDCTGAICHVSAEHTCMSMRGVQAHGALTTTIAYAGEFEGNLALRNQFLDEASKVRVTS